MPRQKHDDVMIMLRPMESKHTERWDAISGEMTRMNERLAALIDRTDRLAGVGYDQKFADMSSRLHLLEQEVLCFREKVLSADDIRILKEHIDNGSLQANLPSDGSMEASRHAEVSQSSRSSGASTHMYMASQGQVAQGVQWRSQEDDSNSHVSTIL